MLFSIFILLCKKKLGCASEILKTYFGISLGLHELCNDETNVSSNIISYLAQSRFFLQPFATFQAFVTSNRRMYVVFAARVRLNRQNEYEKE